MAVEQALYLQEALFLLLLLTLFDRLKPVLTTHQSAHMVTVIASKNYEGIVSGEPANPKSI